jgi:hypothetical protein
MRKVLLLFGSLLVALTVGFNTGAQQRRHPPSISFGMAYVSIGMTREQVEQNLTQGGRHLELLPDKQTELVVPNGKSGPQDREGEVMFVGGRAVFAEFDFPETASATELAQEVAGAVDEMDSKVCAISNYTSHGTGGSVSETLFDCGGKGFYLSTSELLGNVERDTNVAITIGSLPGPG